MDIGETEKVHEIVPSEVDVAPEDAPTEPLPDFTPSEKPVVPEREREPVPA